MMKTLENYLALAAVILGLIIVFVDMSALVKLIGGIIVLSVGVFVLVQTIRKTDA